MVKRNLFRGADPRLFPREKKPYREGEKTQRCLTRVSLGPLAKRRSDHRQSLFWNHVAVIRVPDR